MSVGEYASLWALAVVILCFNPVRAGLFNSRPLVIAHRGSPCSHPEETVASYQEALKQGADYLELDLVATKDSKLVLRHDATLDDSTNIIDLAASGSITQSTDTRQLEPGSSSVTGFFVTDFSLQELKALDAKQPFAFRSAEHTTGGEQIAQISEIFALFKSARRNGSSAGLYMELKHPQYHADLGKDMPKLLMQEIQKAGVTPAEARDLVVQCFELESLRQFSVLMRQVKYDIPLVLLVDCEEGLPGLETMQKLNVLSSEAGIGPHKSLLLATKGSPECGNAGQRVCKPGASGKSNSNCIGRLQAGYSQLHPHSESPQHAWVQQAKSLGLVVHAWTLRNEDRYMALDFRGDCHLEMDALVSEAEGLGIDGVFVDCPISANRWKKGYLTARAAGRFTAAQGSKKTAFFTDDDDVEPEIRPVAAISTYAIVCVLIAACGVYAWIRRQQDVSLHGTYKVMTSPRVDDANADSQRNSQRGSQRDSQQGQTLDIE